MKVQSLPPIGESNGFVQEIAAELVAELGRAY
jgi:hypothetical protein